MKYDPIELMKLDLTEDSIQEKRDYILDKMTIVPDRVKQIVFIFPYIYLQFIIDVFDGFTIKIEPFNFPNQAKITVDL